MNSITLCTRGCQIFHDSCRANRTVQTAILWLVTSNRPWVGTGDGTRGTFPTSHLKWYGQACFHLLQLVFDIKPLANQFLTVSVATKVRTIRDHEYEWDSRSFARTRSTVSWPRWTLALRLTTASAQSAKSSPIGFDFD